MAEQLPAVHGDVYILFKEVKVGRERVGSITKIAILVSVNVFEKTISRSWWNLYWHLPGLWWILSPFYLQKILSSAEICVLFILELWELYPHSEEAETSCCTGFASKQFSVWSINISIALESSPGTDHDNKWDMDQNYSWNLRLIFVLFSSIDAIHNKGNISAEVKYSANREITFINTATGLRDIFFPYTVLILKAIKSLRSAMPHEVI